MILLSSFKKLAFFTFLTVSAIGTPLEQHTITLTKQLQDQILMVGRLGLTQILPAVSLGSEGHILSPKIESIDGSDTPYLLYRRNGSREILETIKDLEKRSSVLLKLPEGVEVTRSTIAPAPKSNTWFYLPVVAPSPTIGEKVSIVLSRSHPLSSSPENLFAVKQGLLPVGTPIFNLEGALTGVSMKLRKKDGGQSIRALDISRLLEDFPELEGVTISDKKIPKFGELPKGKQHPATGLIINEGRPLTNSIVGTIIRSDGLILTKASDLGPDFLFRFQGQDFPAALLATDQETDLALIAISAQNLPTVSWSDPETLKAGSFLYHHTLLGDASAENSEAALDVTSTFSHQLPAHPVSQHDSSQTTSLGLIPEQLESDFVIAAIRPDSPATESDLKAGDRLKKIDNQTIRSRYELTLLLTQKEVGDVVELSIQRGEEHLTRKLTLSPPPLLPKTTGLHFQHPQLIMPSVYRGPFPETLAHSLPLSAWDCGSPLLDPEGHVYGINIAAITPTRALALPPSVIKAAVTRMMTSLSF